MSAPKTGKKATKSTKKPAAKAAKKAAPKKAVAKKPVAKKPVAEKAAPKKGAAKKASASKRATGAARGAQLSLALERGPERVEAAARAESPLDALRRAAQAGDAAAQSELADAYYVGRGVPQDASEAARLWTLAAARGDAAAKESLAGLYVEGEGVARDLDRALALYRECAAAGRDVAALVAWLEEQREEAAGPQPPLPHDEGEAIAMLARRAGLDRVAEATSALRRSSIRLSKSAATSGASRLGGAPELAPGTAWPTGASGRPLSFVAQIDCAEAWPFDLEQRLPFEGRLAFFCDLEPARGRREVDPRACAVLYEPAGERLVETSPPDPERATPELAPRAVLASNEPTLPVAGARAVSALGLDDDEHEGYVALRDALVPAHLGDRRPPLHRMLGHADALRGDPALTAARAGSPAPAAGGDAEHATLLLQLDADAEVATPWTEGRLFVWIRDADLAARRFDAAWAYLER